MGPAQNYFFVLMRFRDLPHTTKANRKTANTNLEAYKISILTRVKNVDDILQFLCCTSIRKYDIVFCQQVT